MKNYLFNTLKDNKGYMLVEIILASTIAFLIAYFAIDLTIKVKEKNDDLYFQTLVGTDQSIITNAIMKKIKEAENAGGLSEFNCNLTTDGKKLSLNGSVIDIINENATIDKNKTYCKNDTNQSLISAVVAIKLEQFPKKDFNVYINYKYQIPKVEFTFEVIDIKTSMQPGGVSYVIQVKNGDEWVNTNVSGVTVANKTFKAFLDSNRTYRAQTQGGGYNLQTSQEFSSGPSNSRNVTIRIFKGNPDEIEIVLTWKIFTDLDAHLFVTGSYSRGFTAYDHLYFKSPKDSQKRPYIRSGTAVLDLDNINSPTTRLMETITVKRDAFDFSYIVHNYGHYCYDVLYPSTLCPGSEVNDKRFMKSGNPTVSIIDGGGGEGSNAVHYDDITMSSSCTSGHTWNVFSYDKATHRVNITNTCTNDDPFY